LLIATSITVFQTEFEVKR